MNPTKPKIIIVDDNERFRKLVKDFVEVKGVGYVVGEFSNGNDLLDALNTIYTNIILMDIRMPGINGIEATKKINQRFTNQIKVIALSQNDDFEYMEEMIKAGAIAYVCKSELHEHLFSAIHNAMNGNIYYPKLHN